MKAPARAVAPDYAALLLLPMTETERVAIDALVEHGSQHAAADALGWKRTKLQSRLRSVQGRQRAAVEATPAAAAPVVHGHVPAPQPNDLFSTAGAGRTTARYILTSAQNNTPVHPQFLANLEAYAEAIGARIMIARYSYNKSAYGAKSVKAGRAPNADDHGELWYDPAISQYVCDDPERHGSCRWMLAPDLMWCAEDNNLPTAPKPLTGMKAYSGPASGVFPHAKIQIDPVPVFGNAHPKFNYSTGTVTQRNYIQKRTGIKAEFYHAYGALLVEVDLVTGDWWARHLNATDDGSFYDLTRYVKDGEVTLGHRLLAIQWGDIHASEIDPAVRALNWGLSHGRAVIDVLRPEIQFWHDTLSFRNRSHHEQKSLGARYQKFCGGRETDSVEHELKVTADLFVIAHRDWCKTVVVSSNHDRHGEKWLDECDPKQDLVNAEFYCEAQLTRLRAMREQTEWDFFKWAMFRESIGSDEDRFWAVRRAQFLRRDEDFYIGPPGHQVQCGQHGDEGANGARGSAAGYAQMPVRINIGHAHAACILNGVKQAGVCQRRLPYAKGPSSWSITHIPTYQNGKGCLLTMRGGKLWL